VQARICGGAGNNPTNPLGLVTCTWCCEGHSWFGFEARRGECGGGALAGDGSGGGSWW